MTVRVLLADDQALLRVAFKVVLSAAPDLEVVGEASTGTAAIELAARTRADVILMDIRMPELDGLTATQLITADEELAGVRILIVTTFDFDEYVFRAVRAGASGFVGKGIQPAELIEAVRVVARGDALLSPTATKALIARYLDHPDRTGRPDHPDHPDHPGVPVPDQRLSELTDREREVVTLAGQGLSNDEIAEHLIISAHTAKTHIKRAMLKLRARDRAQLVVFAYEAGLVRPAE